MNFTHALGMTCEEIDREFAKSARAQARLHTQRDALLAACKAARDAINSLPIGALGWAKTTICGEPAEYPIRDALACDLMAAIDKAEDRHDDRDASAYEIEQGYADAMLSQMPRDEA